MLPLPLLAACMLPVHTAQTAGGGQQQAFSYLVAVSDASGATATAVPRTGNNITGVTADVLNAAIQALPHHGGTIFLTAGTYVLNRTVVIDRSSVEIRGENMGGDLFFTGDSFYNGFANKTAVVIVADGIDAFHVGDSPSCRTKDPRGGYFMNGTSCLVFGTSFMDLGISGVNTDAAIRADAFSNGSGIRVSKADTIRMENLDIRRKQFGVNMGQAPGLEFAYDHVIDVWTANNLYLSFNQYGIWQTGWVSNVRLRNIFGYINERSLIHADTKYDWLVDGVMSQSDGNYGLSPTDAPIYLSTRQDVTIRHVTIAANTADDTKHPQTPPIPLLYILLERAHDASGEWYRGHVKADTLTLFGSNSDAIFVKGTGFLDIHNLHAGSTHCMDAAPSCTSGGQSFYGGPGVIGGYCVNAAGPETSVYVDGGFCRSNVTGITAEGRNPRNLAMHNLTKVANVRNYNPMGKITTPFDPAGFIGPSGTEPSPTQGKRYTVRGGDLLMHVGTTTVGVTIRDGEGEPFYTATARPSSSSALPTSPPLTLLVGFSVTFDHVFGNLSGVVAVAGS